MDFYNARKKARGLIEFWCLQPPEERSKWSHLVSEIARDYGFGETFSLKLLKELGEGNFYIHNDELCNKREEPGWKE